MTTTLMLFMTSTKAALAQDILPATPIISQNVITAAITVVIFVLLCSLIVFIISRVNRKRLERLAYVDSVTGLSTFAKFRIDAKHILRNAAPGQYMVIGLDINNFKFINDALGYDVGNELLASMGRRLIATRKPKQRLCRLSADQFLVFSESIPLDVIRSDFMNSHTREPLLDVIGKSDFRITFSVGVYYIQDPTEDFYRIIDKVNIARKQVKGSHATSVNEFTSLMADELENNKDITMGMERGLKRHEFQLYLQPKFLLGNQHVSGAEALVRWHHPERGLMMPNDFIPLFERNGFILKLDLYMFEEVCRQLARWKENGSDISGWRISVNLSRYCMRFPDIVESLEYIARSYSVSPSLLELELTESIVEDNTDRIIELITKLKAAGFEVSIDDFGSGYSSLNMLTDLPVNTVKLDKGFLQKVYESDKGKEMIAMVIHMINTLKMGTVAEGVETREQMEYLRELGCDMAQGYYFARPVTINNFEDICGFEHTKEDS